MPSNQNLKRLMAAGMSAYPAGSFGNVAPRPPHIDGATKRAWRPEDKLVRRTEAWGSTPMGALQPRRVTPGERERARTAFLRWLKKEHPALAARAVKLSQLPPLGSLGAEGEPSTWEKLFDNISNLAQTALTYKTQKQVLDMQLDRARQGLAPLDASQYSPVVRVTTDAATMQQAAAAATSNLFASVRPYLLPLGLGLGALLLLRGKKSRRR